MRTLSTSARGKAGIAIRLGCFAVAGIVIIILLLGGHREATKCGAALAERDHALRKRDFALARIADALGDTTGLSFDIDAGKDQPVQQQAKRQPIGDIFPETEQGTASGGARVGRFVTAQVWEWAWGQHADAEPQLATKLVEAPPCECPCSSMKVRPARLLDFSLHPHADEKHRARRRPSPTFSDATLR